MFVHFMVLASWAPVLGRHLELQGFDKYQIGAVTGSTALALILAALVFGEIADRWMAAEKVLAINLFVTAVFLCLAARVQAGDPAKFAKTWWLLFGAMVFYSPTISVASALCFRHLPDPRRDFPVVRLFGTIGWMAAAQVLWAWMALTGRPIGDCLNLGAAFALVSSLYALSLPPTPPGHTGSGFAAVKSLRMLRDPSFAVFLIASFVLSIFASFVYHRAGEFFSVVGVQDRLLGATLSIAQVTEIAAMLLLPRLYARAGAKGTIAVGMTLWVARFGLLALGAPAWLMIATQAFHGFCFTLASVTGQVYIERICDKGARASAQALHGLVGGGLGMFAGAHVGGWVLQGATTAGTTAWPDVWLTAAAGCAAALVLLLAGFRPRDAATPPAPPP
jgi:nucleoside transporter